MKKFLYVSLYGLLFSQTAFAIIEPKIVLALRGGVDNTKVGETQDVTSTYSQIAPNRYVVTDEWQYEPFLGIYAGIELPAKFYRGVWQFGIGAYQTTVFENQGLVEVFSSPGHTNYDYQYNIRNRRVLAEAKWLIPLNQQVSVYVEGGAGVNSNKAYNYKETPRESETSPTYFADQTLQSFSYILGFGIETRFTDHIHGSLGYRYANLGEAELGEAENAIGTTSQRLGNTTMPTNEFIFQLSYVFDALR